MAQNDYNLPKPFEKGLNEEEVRSLVDSMLQNYPYSIRILSGKLLTQAVQLTDRSATPTTGTWQRGTVISVAGVLYVCTTTGTPGSWTKVGAQ